MGTHRVNTQVAAAVSLRWVDRQELVVGRPFVVRASPARQASDLLGGPLVSGLSRLPLTEQVVAPHAVKHGFYTEHSADDGHGRRHQVEQHEHHGSTVGPQSMPGNRANGLARTGWAEFAPRTDPAMPGTPLYTDPATIATCTSAPRPGPPGPIDGARRRRPHPRRRRSGSPPARRWGAWRGAGRDRGARGPRRPGAARRRCTWVAISTPAVHDLDQPAAAPPPPPAARRTPTRPDRRTRPTGSGPGLVDPAGHPGRPGRVVRTRSPRRRLADRIGPPRSRPGRPSVNRSAGTRPPQDRCGRSVLYSHHPRVQRRLRLARWWPTPLMRSKNSARIVLCSRSTFPVVVGEYGAVRMCRIPFS